MHVACMKGMNGIGQLPVAVGSNLAEALLLLGVGNGQTGSTTQSGDMQMLQSCTNGGLSHLIQILLAKSSKDGVSPLLPDQTGRHPGEAELIEEIKMALCDALGIEDADTIAEHPFAAMVLEMLQSYSGTQKEASPVEQGTSHVEEASANGALPWVGEAAAMTLADLVKSGADLPAGATPGAGNQSTVPLVVTTAGNEAARTSPLIMSQSHKADTQLAQPSPETSASVPEPVNQPQLADAVTAQRSLAGETSVKQGQSGQQEYHPAELQVGATNASIKASTESSGNHSSTNAGNAPHQIPAGAQVAHLMKSGDSSAAPVTELGKSQAGLEGLGINAQLGASPQAEVLSMQGVQSPPPVDRGFVASPGEDVSLVDQLADGLVAGKVGQKIIVRLDPPELGAVRASFEARGDSVRCVLRVENPQILEQVQREASALVERLIDSGVNLRQVSVEMGSSSAGQQAPQGWNAPGEGSGGQQGQQGEQRGYSWNQEPTSNEAEAHQHHAGVGEGLLNVWI